MEIVPNKEDKRILTTEEKLIESNYRLKKLQGLIGILSGHLGNEKVMKLARMGNYPKTDEQIQDILDSKLISKKEIDDLKEIYKDFIGMGLNGKEVSMKKLKNIFE